MPSNSIVLASTYRLRIVRGEQLAPPYLVRGLTHHHGSTGVIATEP